MPKVTIKDLAYQEAAPQINWLTSYAFRPTPPIHDQDETLEVLKQTDPTTRHLILFEDDQPVACAGAGQMTQNVRGKIMPISGIFRVVTHPSARRKGYSFRLLAELLKAERDNGSAFTCLYPFRESFYQRLGYVSFPLGFKAHIVIRGLLPLAKQGYGEDVELVEYINDPKIYSDTVDDFKQHTHGMASFVTEVKPNPKRHKHWLAVVRVNGEIDGMLVYTLSGDSPTKFKFDISRFYYHSAATRYQLLGWIARHIDQTSEVVITMPAFERPNTWFEDLEIDLERNWIAPMGRVLDISKLDGLPIGLGAFTAQVTDPVCPWNEGFWKFERQNGLLKVSPADSADCTLSIQGLSALIYGTNPPADFQFRSWGNPSPDLQTMISAMFPLASPHLHAYF